MGKAKNGGRKRSTLNKGDHGRGGGGGRGCQTQVEMAGLQQSRNVRLGSAGQPERRCCAAST